MRPMDLPTVDQIAARAAAVRRTLDEAAARAGRDPAGVRIVAITKGWPIEVCRAARDAGLTALGENRVQEALPKVAALPDLAWHLVGHLQSNKARAAAAAFAWIHSVDSAALLRRLDAAAHDAGSRPRALLQVNVTGEATKSGFDPRALADAAVVAAVRDTRSIEVVGLMTIAAAGGDPRPAFTRLRGLRDELEQRAGIALPELSMGMSGDAAIAVEEGATVVRIGTALFGARPAGGG